jgi:hypothetical protein
MVQMLVLVEKALRVFLTSKVQKLLLVVSARTSRRVPQLGRFLAEMTPPLFV